MLYPARMITVSIARTPEDVYAFAADPQHLPQWIPSFVTGVRQSGDDWFVQTEMGEARIAFVPHNDLGVLDHVVTLSNGEQVLNPLRVIPNGHGSEVQFTLFQREGMTEEQFDADAAMVEADLATLKEVLERDAEA